MYVVCIKKNKIKSYWNNFSITIKGYSVNMKA